MLASLQRQPNSKPLDFLKDTPRGGAQKNCPLGTTCGADPARADLVGPSNAPPVNNPSAAGQAASAEKSGQDATASRTPEEMKTQSDCTFAKEGCRPGSTDPVNGGKGGQPPSSPQRPWSDEQRQRLSKDERGKQIIAEVDKKLIELRTSIEKIEIIKAQRENATTEPEKQKLETQLSDELNNQGRINDNLTKLEKEGSDLIYKLDPNNKQKTSEGGEKRRSDEEPPAPSVRPN